MKIQELIEKIKTISEKRVLNIDTLPLVFNKDKTTLNVECVYCLLKTNPNITDFLRQRSRCRCKVYEHKPLNSIRVFSKVSDDYKIHKNAIKDEKLNIFLPLTDKYTYLRSKENKIITILSTKLMTLFSPNQDLIIYEEKSNEEEINLTKYVNKDGDIFISKFEFRKLKLRDDASQLLLDFLLAQYKTPILKIFNMNFNDQFKILKNKPLNIVNNIGELSIKPNNYGCNILNHFIHPILMKSHMNNKPSFEDVWNSKKLLKTIIDKTLTHSTKFNNNTLFNVYGYHFGRPYNFPASTAKALYDRYNAKKVLDFSAGYGGRLLGFWASNAQEYIGIDPNRNIPYSDMIKYFSTFCVKKAKIINEAAEDVDFSEFKEVDMIFTSPPYFDTEIYDDNDEKQSCNRYKEFEDWIDKFLFTVIRKSISVLKNNGIFSINIKDHTKYAIVDRMIKFIEELGLTKIEYIRFDHSKRYVSNTKYEYIYVFKK